MKIMFSPQVKLLLVPQSSQTVDMQYADNPFTWTMPLIGRRPPYYASPRYEWSYPVI
ncbi:hypothetical protein [Gorillibacterium sp. sgz500922]|uniref:hypothetical protein n=1 Tax=Gorillibacterium sp. sgz500922 TaxID=3446694 RepID=UPI003F66C805